MSRSQRSLRRMARTSDIGFRRDPQPPMPSVIPLRSSPMTSSSVIRLSATTVPFTGPCHKGSLTVFHLDPQC